MTNMSVVIKMYYNRPIKNHNIAMRIVPMGIVMSGLKCLNHWYSYTGYCYSFLFPIPFDLTRLGGQNRHKVYKDSHAVDNQT